MRPDRRYAQPVSEEREAELLAGHAAAMARRRRRGTPPITRVLPRPVRLTLGGRSVRVGELTLWDLAELQQWLADRAIHPCDQVTATDPAERKQQLRAAWEAAKSWPPRFGSADARPFVSTAEWSVQVLTLALRRGDPTTTDEATLALAARMSLADWSRVYRIAYGTEAWQELLQELDPEPEDDHPRLVNWVEAICQMIEHRPGWTFEAVGNLTLSQWRALRGGAEAFSYRCEPRLGENLKDARERERRMLSAEAGEESTAPRPGSSPSFRRPE